MDERTTKLDSRPARAPAAREPAPAPALKRKPKSRLRRGLNLLLVLGLVSLGYWGYQRMHAPQERRERLPQAWAQPVGAAGVSTGDIRIMVNALGTVTPLATVTVRTQINGQLTEVGFKEGQIVKKGDFLAQIDPRPYEAAEQQAEGQLLRDQGLLDQARMDLARYQNLMKTQAIPRQQAEDQVFLVKQYEGSVKTDQAQIAMQKLNIMYCRIVSPVDGRVGLRLVDPGNYVQTIDTSGIAVITQLQPISVIFTVAEDELPEIMAQMQAGAALQVTVSDRGNVRELAKGRLSTVDNQIDTTTGTIKLRAEFDNADGKLFPNQFVNAQLLVKTLKGAVTVPTTAVQRGAPGTFVYLINDDETVSVRPIKLGPADGELTAVESGLTPGQRVVVDGADRLREGARVTIPGSGPGAAGPGTTNAPRQGPEQAPRERGKGRHGG